MPPPGLRHFAGFDRHHHGRVFVAHLCGEIRAASLIGTGHADGAAHELQQVVQRPDEEGVVG